MKIQATEGRSGVRELTISRFIAPMDAAAIRDDRTKKAYIEHPADRSRRHE
ncbi:MAG: hypothetical protein JSR56_08270 [Proteobacteria bacterium]|nr:hypothetical protein [Pseudomonadota bacterium]